MAMNGDVTRAMILAAGDGTRLYPFTLETSKVLLPVGGIPLIQHTLVWLRRHGISEVAINLHHFGDKIRAFLGDGSAFGVTVHYSPEQQLQGTAGGIKRIARFFNGTFLVIYGDVLTDFNLSAMVEFHVQREAVATLAIFEAPDPREVGVVELDPEGKVLSFMEKSSSSTARPVLASGGIYVLKREVLDYIPDEGCSDFGSDILPELIRLGLPVYGFRLKAGDYLIDIGTVDKYQRANNDVLNGRVKTRGWGEPSLMTR